MAITYVGSASNSITTSAATFNIDISGLGLQQGDLVLVATGFVSTADGNPGVTTSGYTEVADLYSNGTGTDTNLSINWKLMGSTPDTSVTCSGSGSASNSSAGVAYVLRGVDQTTPLDVTTTTATGSGTNTPPNPPSITPTTSGAWVVVFGAVADSSSDTTVTAPSGYSNAVIVGTAGSNDIAIAAASKAWTSGAEDPAAWTNWTTASTSSYAAATLAIRPASTGAKGTVFRSIIIRGVPIR